MPVYPLSHAWLGLRLHLFPVCKCGVGYVADGIVMSLGVLFEMLLYVVVVMWFSPLPFHSFHNR
jgi:hypothetical protein